jgi:hypothetical protein
MKNLAIKLVILLVLIIVSLSVKAQYTQEEEEAMYEPLKLSGPRVGMTYIGGDLGDQMIEYGLNPYISQFGWQFETRYFTTKTGFQGLVETVILLGGFETEEPVLSGSLLFGFRTRTGFEAGAGPNLSTASGNAMVFAIGHTAKTEYVNIPVNFAIVPSSESVKYTFLVGFNIRRH